MKNLVNSGRYVFQGLECLNDLVATAGCKFFSKNLTELAVSIGLADFLFVSENLKTAKIHSNSTMNINLEP